MAHTYQCINGVYVQVEWIVCVFPHKNDFMFNFCMSYMRRTKAAKDKIAAVAAAAVIVVNGASGEAALQHN